MAPPVLLVVDEQRDVLEDIEGQLAKRYGADYRVKALSDPEQALRTLAKLADAREVVALLLVGESLSDVSGSELLERARALHPQAKRGLAVSPGAWGDPETADAIRSAMSLGHIDYYVPK